MLKLTNYLYNTEIIKNARFFRNKNKTFFAYDIELRFTNEFTYQFGCSAEINAVSNILSLYSIINTVIKIVIASHGQINKCS